MKKTNTINVVFTGIDKNGDKFTGRVSFDTSIKSQKTTGKFNYEDKRKEATSFANRPYQDEDTKYNADVIVEKLEIIGDEFFAEGVWEDETEKLFFDIETTITDYR